MTKAKKRTAKVWAVQFRERGASKYRLAALPMANAEFAIAGVMTNQTDALSFKRAWDSRGPLRGRVIEARLTWSEPAPKAKRSAR